MNFSDSSTNPYEQYTTMYVSCPFCGRLVDRRANPWALYCRPECKAAFRSGLHERVNEALV